MKMKVKTNKAAKKRLRFTASGKVKHKGAFGRHIMKAKNAKRKRRIKKQKYVNPSYDRMINALLPNG
ncbi:MAG: 50S ribosomal protein L35 [Oligoflexia bacterium]|nr:50S ribosomal protein L35 [Oligoflexia bacterium]